MFKLTSECLERLLTSKEADYILQEDFFYDTVTNIENAGWNDVLAVMTNLRFVDGNSIIVPAGTHVTLSEEEVNHYYYKMAFDSGEWVPVNKDDIINVLIRSEYLPD